MNTSNPYQAPRASSKRLEDGSYRPRVGDWIILLLLVPLVCIIAFFATCFGSALALFGIAGPHLPEISILFPFLIGGIAAGVTGWFVVTRYLRSQKRWYERRRKEEAKLEEAKLIGDSESDT